MTASIISPLSFSNKLFGFQYLILEAQISFREKNCSDHFRADNRGEILFPILKIWVNQSMIDRQTVINLLRERPSSANLNGLNLSRLDLSSLNFSFCNLRNVDFTGAILSNSDFTGADLSYALLNDATLMSANLSRALLDQVELKGYELNGAILNSAELRGVSLEKAELTGLDFTNCNLTSVFFREANLTGCNFENAKILASDFHRANLYGANFTGALIEKTILEEVAYDHATIWPTAFDLSNTGVIFEDTSSLTHLQAQNKNSPIILTGHKGDVLSLTYDSTLDLLVSGGDDKKVYLWDIANLSLKVSLKGHNSAVLGAKIGHSGKLLASVDADSKIKLWDIGASRTIATLYDRDLTLWSEKDRKNLHLEIGFQELIYSIEFNPFSNMLLSVGASSRRQKTFEVKFWDITNFQLLHLFDQDFDFWQIFFGSQNDQPYLIGCRPDNSVEIVNLTDFSSSVLRDLHKTGVKHLAGKNGNDLFVTVGFDGLVKVWRIGIAHSQMFFEFPGNIRLLVLSADSTLLAAATEEKIYIWHLETGELISLQEFDHLTISAMCFVDKHKYLATSFFNSPSIYLWNYCTPQ